MKAITLHQPWATLLARGIKKHETRTWNTLHRGPLIIHAGKAKIIVPRRVMLLLAKTLGTRYPVLPMGAIVGIFNVYNSRPIMSDDLREMTEREILLGDWQTSRFAWMGSLHRTMHPIPCRGRQGLWNIPPELEGRLKGKLEEAYGNDRPAT